MRKLLIALVLAAGMAACTAPPPDPVHLDCSPTEVFKRAA